MSFNIPKIWTRFSDPTAWQIFRLFPGEAPSPAGRSFSGPGIGTLSRLREKFDYVIVDTSPVFASDEVSTLAPRADGTLFVVRRGMSRSGPVAEAMDLLARRQARILGIVINGIDAGSKSNYYYNYSEYYQRLVDDAPKVAG